MLKRKHAIREQVRQAALALQQRGLHHSEERISPLLRETPILSFADLNQMLKEIREELGLPTL